MGGEYEETAVIMGGNGNWIWKTGLGNPIKWVLQAWSFWLLALFGVARCMRGGCRLLQDAVLRNEKRGTGEEEQRGERKTEEGVNFKLVSLARTMREGR